MTPRTRGALAALAIVAGLGLAAAVLHAGDARYPAMPPTERLLYLKSGRRRAA